MLSMLEFPQLQLCKTGSDRLTYRCLHDKVLRVLVKTWDRMSHASHVSSARYNRLQRLTVDNVIHEAIVVL